MKPIDKEELAPDVGQHDRGPALGRLLERAMWSAEDRPGAAEEHRQRRSARSVRLLEYSRACSRLLRNLGWIDRLEHRLGLVAENFPQALLLPRTGTEALALDERDRARGESGAKVPGQVGLRPPTRPTIEFDDR